MMAWTFFHELGRKAIHLSILLVLLGYYIIDKIFSKQTALLSLVGLLIFFLVMEFFRLELKLRPPFLAHFIREKEQNRMYGTIFFISAAIICFAVFDYKVALAALLMAAFGDAAAAIVGKSFGKKKIYQNKTWAGCFAEFTVNLIVGLIILSRTNIFLILPMAILATIAETLVDELDDNLVVPIIAGFIGQIIFMAI
jgi:phytol kinase